MICIEILNSFDTDSIGSYKFGFDRITIGNSKNSFLTVYENFFDGEKMTIKVLDDKLFIDFNQKNYTVNGIKFSGTKAIKENDLIKVGGTEFRITSFKQDFDSSFNLTEEITELKKIIQHEQPKRMDLIIQIEDEIISLEQNEN